MYTDAPEAIAIVQRAFPSYTHAPGKLEVVPFKSVVPASYWSGGTKDLWSFVRLDDAPPGTPDWAHIPENGSGFGQTMKAIEILPPGFALVRQTIGSFKAAAIYLNPENLTLMLPPPVELTDDEKIVLCMTKRLKSAARLEYSARKAKRNEYDPATRVWYDNVRAQLVTKGMLTKQGATTTAGKNAADTIGIQPY